MSYICQNYPITYLSSHSRHIESSHIHKASLDRFKVAFWPESHSANAPRRSGDSEKRESSTSSRPRDSVMGPSSLLTPQNEQQISPVSAGVPVLLSTTQAL